MAGNTKETMMIKETVDTIFGESARQVGSNAFYENGEVRLYVSASGGVMGGTDFGAAITETNSRLADILAAALRKADYTKAVLVLDARESADLAAAHFGRPVDESGPCPF
jgi:hypothetical protein